MKLNTSIFSRVIFNSRFIPELDGLRFLAIIAVIFFHVNAYLNEKVLNFNYSFFAEFFKSGFFGVEIFFCISGYVLSRQILSNKSFKYKEYIKRRLLRIEPPFLISLILMWLLNLFFKSYSIGVLIQSFFQTVTYTTNIFGNNILNGVSWSLEIEVQFYLILPIILKYIQSTSLRFYFALFILSVVGFFVNFLKLSNHIFLLNFIQWFCIGILISYLELKKINFNTYFTGLNSIIILSIFLLHIPFLNTPLWSDVLSFFLLIILLNNILILKKGITFWSNSFIATIGGMCYTIYLYHYPLISFFGRLMVSFFKFEGFSNSIIYFYSILPLILLPILFSIPFFIFFERPFMKKDWFPNFFKFDSKPKL